MKAKARGQCFKWSFRLLCFDYQRGEGKKLFTRFQLDHRTARIVHGFVTNPIEGWRFAHAWIEVRTLLDEEVVLQVGEGYRKAYIMDKFVHYDFGKIVPAECRRFTRKQALRLANKGTRWHWRCWARVPSDILPEASGGAIKSQRWCPEIVPR